MSHHMQRHTRACATHLPDGTMQIVYDSQNYHVIEYSGIDGFEVTNKSAQSCAYFHVPVAVAFRDNFA